MAFYTALTGLQAAQTDIATISNNVANVGTNGFKKSRAEFGDIIAASTYQNPTTVIGQGTRLKDIQQQFTQGTFETTDRALDLAITGQGFFTTRGANGGAISYTRDGAFSVDANQNVVDANGAYLQVLPVDSGGAVTATGIGSARNLTVPLTNGTSKATSTISLTANLPSNATVPTKAFDRTDPDSYNYSTNTTVYDSAGNALPATLYFTRTQVPSATDPTSKWEARLFVGDQQASADAAATTPTPVTLSFDAAGALTSPTTATAFSAVSPSGAVAPLALSVDLGTATAQATGAFAVSASSQDGTTAGQLDGVTVDNTGLVTATFSNGTEQKLGKVVMASFSNPEGLRQLGDGRWSATGLSGEPIVGAANSNGFGAIQSGALEQSNVDISSELVDLIAAQQHYQANAKAIETANTLISTITNLRT